MGDWGPGPRGNHVSIWMGTAQALVCADHGPVTALALAAGVVSAKGPGSRLQIAQGTSA